MAYYVDLCAISLIDHATREQQDDLESLYPSPRSSRTVSSVTGMCIQHVNNYSLILQTHNGTLNYFLITGSSSGGSSRTNTPLPQLDTVPKEPNSRRGTMERSVIHVPHASTAHTAGQAPHDEALDPGVGGGNGGITDVREADDPVRTSRQGSQVYNRPTADNEGKNGRKLWWVCKTTI